ncbi:MAG TPA: hypothetical protein VFT02_07860, partial [Pyrinomonadaceae bacterium]|nr:hypothetical protein [Pyrinomonadaceae bacterium]
MKSILNFTLFTLMFWGVSVSARAVSTNEVFVLPDSRAGEVYQLDIEALLREKYRLRIETSTRESILQWSLVDGELPAGLTVRTSGNVAGIPERPRETPYLFRVRVVDRTASAADALIVSLSLVVAPPRLRLTRIEGPTLVPLDNSTTSSQANGARPPDNSRTAESALSPPPVRPPETKIDNRHHLPVASGPIKPPSAQRGLFKKIAGVIGLDDDTNKPRKPEGCEDGSKARRAVSDEAHNPLEGDTSIQSTCVEFKNLNTLKYRIEFNTKTSRSEGPDLGSLPFLPKVPLTTTTPPTSPSGNEPSKTFLNARTLGVSADKIAAANEKAAEDFRDDVAVLNEEFRKAREALNTAETSLREDVEMAINNFTTALENAHARSKSLANDADSYLQGGNTKGLLEQIDSLSKEIALAVANDWPSDEILDVLTILDIVTSTLEDLRSRVAEDVWKEWLVANQDRYNRVRDRAIELKTKVSALNSRSFEDAKKVLVRWQGVLKNIEDQKENAFSQVVFVSCHTDEGESKSSKLTISKTDRTADNPSAVTREVLTVHCYSRVTVTAGFNFSTLDEKEFSVVESAGGENGATVKKFGFTNRSSFRPNPLALLNIRFTNNPEYNLHASFGAVVDLKGQTGTDVEPVAGVSFSIRRLIFITPFALHFGRVNKLAGGFNE